MALGPCRVLRREHVLVFYLDFKAKAVPLLPLPGVPPGTMAGLRHVHTGHERPNVPKNDQDC